MAIYLTGSLAYDRLMQHPGNFSESILPGQLDNLNVSFFISQLDEKLGGNAGNIAYSLYLLEEMPIIVAAAGSDFDKYKNYLLGLGLSLEGINIVPNELTAGCYITTDVTNKQIAAFHAAALMFPTTYTFPNLNAAADIGIICPTNPDDMRLHPELYKKHGVRYIYDPSQQLPVLSGEDLLKAINGCYLLIGNDYEIELIISKTGKTKDQLLAMTQQGIITTLAEKGSLITRKNGEEIHIAAVPVSHVANPTGAGDAYRSGLLKGLIHGRDIVKSACLGATCAAYCIEHKGTQDHTFTTEEFTQRHLATFGVHNN